MDDMVITMSFSNIWSFVYILVDASGFQIQFETEGRVGALFSFN